MATLCGVVAIVQNSELILVGICKSFLEGEVVNADLIHTLHLVQRAVIYISPCIAIPVAERGK